MSAAIDFSQHGLDSTPAFSLEGLTTLARVVDVYDGDTLTAVLPLGELMFPGSSGSGSRFYRFNVRINGIDTCELKSHCEETKALATKARARMLDLVLAGGGGVGRTSTPPLPLSRDTVRALLRDRVCLVTLECGRFDKYGRLLARVLDAETATTDFAATLVCEGLAYAYAGGHKLDEAEQVRALTAATTTR